MSPAPFPGKKLSMRFKTFDIDTNQKATMTEIKRDWDILTDEERKAAIDEIIGYFATERNEEIGVITAGDLLDMFLRTTSGNIYNHALDDVHPLLEKNLTTTLLDIDISLRKNKP